MVKRVLIVDEFIVANDLRLMLQQAGYSVTSIATSVEEAEENLQQYIPDLVLLDIRLKGKKSCIDLARKLRAEDIPFIYLSANSNKEILEEAKITKPYGFLVKPIGELDLLIMIDIAWSRHKQNLEAKLWKEALLQKQLAEICNETIDVKDRMLKICKTIQSYVPFDFFVAGSRPIDALQLNDVGYLRIGLDEYQFIGEKELITIAGLKRNALSVIIENTCTSADAMICNNNTTNEISSAISLQKLFSDCFGLVSYLTFPVQIRNGSSLHYFFYSRNSDNYTKNHIALLNRLKVHLIGISEKLIDDMSSAGTMTGQGFIKVRPGEVTNNTEFKGVVGNHPLLLAALDLTTQVACFNTSVLILGESGTGKEKIAQSIHSLSPRKNGPFIKVNCAAIPAMLMESELFGHEKGAFTGAFEKRKGKFEQANAGTIFLDEVGELPLDMQVKLLRVLQEKEFEPVGGNSSRKVDVRIVAATNRNLEDEVAKGNFRMDLYYRLNVFPITLPPLRDRKSDIEALALFFANRFCREFNKEFRGIAVSMMEEMCAYDWPGNIRELENIMEQAVILHHGKSELELKRRLNVKAATDRLHITTLNDVRHIQRETERDYIISILQKTKGRVRGADGAAELLNIKPTTLESKMAKLAIKKEDFMIYMANF